MKGQMLGSRSLEDDISLAHSVYATSLQSDVSGGRGISGCGPPTWQCSLHSNLTSFVLLDVGIGSVTNLLCDIVRSLVPPGYSFLLYKNEVLDWLTP